MNGQGNKQFAVYGNSFVLRDPGTNEDLMPGVYELMKNPQTGELYLEKTGDKFLFPYKIYGKESSFIDRVKKTYDNTIGNLGCLLNGVKGTGKTVTAKLISNELNLPVIIVQNNFGSAFNSFINSIDYDVVVFIDEYEKIYSNNNSNDGSDSDRGDILTLMDGVMTSKYRKIFLLTTNELYVNKNLLQRPGRIRYLKLFDDLSLDVITEVVDDLLKYPEFKEDTIRFISMLETITIDIVKAVVEEVNIHHESPEMFKDVFNTKTLDKRYSIFEVVSSTENNSLVYKDLLRYKDVTLSRKIKKNSVGNYIRCIDNSEDEYFDLGVITEVITEDEFKCSMRVENPKYNENSEDEPYEITVVKHYKISEDNAYHRSFKGHLVF